MRYVFHTNKGGTAVCRPLYRILCKGCFFVIHKEQDRSCQGAAPAKQNKGRKGVIFEAEVFISGLCPSGTGNSFRRDSIWYGQEAVGPLF